MSVTKNTIQLAKLAALHVPAYRAYLKDHKVDPDKISSSLDFVNLPLTSKKNYLQQYELKDLMWGGKLNQPLTICSTSGSTGLPFYFPRSDELAQQYSKLIEDYLTYNSERSKVPTLAIIAFGMGVWIGGVFTLRAFEIASQRLKYPVSILPTGYNKTEIFKALHQLAPNFGQTILIGYPPFIKEIIDGAEQEDINLKTLNLRIMFAAEAFTETFRDYICERVNANPLLDTLNIYGTADIGAMAYETPISILARRLATNDSWLFQDIFGQIEKTPTLAQFNPNNVDFEEVDKQIVLTGNSALPLIRYAVDDNGGVLSFQQLEKIMQNHGYNLTDLAKKATISHTVRKHPFVFVYERANFAASLHGIVIYPEFIKEGLLHKELVSSLSSKFTMLTKFDGQHNQYLEINVELQKNIEPSDALNQLALEVIHKTLIKKCSEFAEISSSTNSLRLLKIVFWNYEHPKYFMPGVKQKWLTTKM